jgi:glycerol uptake facilitator-like aquaporin|uniref:Major intrinsic protein n=1 Tax=viral metagenome TaxID=1070528 RepID=A0A6C0DWH3_9ZZZZ
MIFEFFTEFIGTFIFLSVILKSGDPLAIGLALASVIYFGGKVSGGNFNPAVSYMMLLSKKIDVTKFVAYIIAQILGATSAFLFHSYTK